MIHAKPLHTCSWTWVDDVAIEESRAKIKQFVVSCQWPEALCEARFMLDTLHKEDVELCTILSHLSPAKFKSITMEATASSCALLGLILQWGWGEQYVSTTAAYKQYSKAAQLGHVWALYKKGLLTHDNASVKCAAQMGCAAACLRMGWSLRKVGKYQRAAHYYLHVGRSEMDSLGRMERILLLSVYTMEGCPWGKCILDKRHHTLVYPHVRQCMFIAMLVCKRLQVPHDVALIIVCYVCTREGWNRCYLQ